ncbi:hypothetical protein GOODEAATRI_027497, partial [Goodea atripinnis]
DASRSRRLGTVSVRPGSTELSPPNQPSYYQSPRYSPESQTPAAAIRQPRKPEDTRR